MNEYDIPPTIAAIIPAAGFGTRMGAAIPKQFLELAGEPVFVRTLRVFLAHPEIHIIVLVLPPEQLQSGKEQLLPFLTPEQQGKMLYTTGGEARQHSVQNGMKALPASIERIFVHDGARPLVSAEIIDRCLAGIEEHGAVIAAVPVKDTLKEVEDGTEIIGTVDRSQLWHAQTPQAMDLHLLERAYEYAAATEFIGTDEASLLEHAGVSVSVVMGSEENIKITRPEDLRIAATLLRENQEGETAMRIGHGFDAHRLVEGRKLILGGVDIPYELGLAGHSDADVLVHALMDALLGALGAGDIGRHFPDTDEQYRGADSLTLLERVIALVKAKKMRLVNADITVVCQQPKLAPHLATMQANLREVCRAEEINIKATTTEEMGYTGRGEGITAHAVVLLTKTA
ncbi:2-C-methyl-D-erythritol 2,4-cyclodiphosphate synthase [Candidatus Electrothrix marina]|uniref:Bifunctional enzyme IspD/IspF n=1 Tax=Candidatus Electrothrix marina TaxID=1859130 RepID=A0A3S3R0A2_9BACT|nr:2-C-methyl-D-erythritol 2,4-cyclodiphosphate synthase [Candidatus Electrothrix marina]RWX50546.1 2-C-methyl-D-erythritol 2,4-cyclodiphosphate synthase [Candidatus Electrothrix marina]RWX52380.1 2-C-methyl-D-erythritol 2,4-cyclodiphosphate synthase [Candidatus Electrothrix marina]